MTPTRKSAPLCCSPSSPPPPLSGNLGFYPIVSSDVPVIAEQTRRPVINENPGPRGGWHLKALPIGDANLELSGK